MFRMRVASVSGIAAAIRSQSRQRSLSTFRSRALQQNRAQTFLRRSAIFATAASSSAALCAAVSTCTNVANTAEADELFTRAYDDVTGSEYPIMFNHPAGGSPLHLIGVGTRCLLQRCEYEWARAYTVGLYVTANASFIDWQARQAGDLACGVREMDIMDPALLHLAATEEDLQVTFRVVFARGFSGKRIAQALDRSLLKRVRVQQNGAKVGKGKDELKRLTQWFAHQDQINEGTEVLFTITNGNRLDFYVNGKSEERLNSHELCAAIMDMYTGPSCVATRARENFAKGFHMVVNKPDAPWSRSPPPGTHRAANIKVK